MAEQLCTARKIYKLINIQNFIHLLGKDVVDSSEDFIKYIVELYTRPDRNTEIDKEGS